MTEPLPAATLDDDIPSMTGARAFVTVVFALIGASFIAQTALFIREFKDVDWVAILLLHSHLFVFFPTLGLLALVAFHLPATVFTHMYWNHIPHGRIRFVFGTAIAVALTLALSFDILVSNPAEVWEIAPRLLAQDRREPVPCAGNPQPCERVTLLEGVSTLRAAAQVRLGISKFARPCAYDELLEEPFDVAQQRYCFASGSKLPGKACCQVQARYAGRVFELSQSARDRSRTDAFDLLALPFKTFFVLVVVTIGVLLVIWRKLLEHTYVAIAPAIERALLIGAAAMMPWPFMDYAYTQAMQALSGRPTSAVELRFSLVIAPWALLLLVFFLARMGRKIERLGQLVGAFASLVAVLRYEQLNDVAVRYLGIGAPWWMLIVLVVFIATCLSVLRWPRHMQRAINGVIGRHPDVGTGPPPGFGSVRAK